MLAPCRRPAYGYGGAGAHPWFGFFGFFIGLFFLFPHLRADRAIFWHQRIRRQWRLGRR
jgi:hypothetical protein